MSSPHLPESIWQFIQDLVVSALQTPNVKAMFSNLLRQEINASLTGLSVHQRTRLMTVAEVADYTKRSAATIRDWIKRGKLRAMHGGRGYLIEHGDLVDCMTRVPQGKSEIDIDHEAADIVRMSRQRREKDE